MALKTTGNGPKNEQNGPTQKAKEMAKQVPIVEEPVLKPGQAKVEIVYQHQGKEVVETRIVPASLIRAMADPGESGMTAKDAMKELSEFYQDVLKKEATELRINGGVSIPFAAISGQLLYAYDVHALNATLEAQKTDAVTSKQKPDESLHLNHPEVEKLVRATAAVLSGVSVEELKKLDVDEATIWVERTVTEVVKEAQITLKTTRIQCDCGSHKEWRDLSVPAGFTVNEAERKTEERLARLPDAKRLLDETFEKIEELRGGNPLSKLERDIVVTHINLNIPDAQNRLPVTP